MRFLISLSAFLVFVSSAFALYNEKRTAEPVNFAAGQWVQPLASTPDTVLNLTFDKSGQPVLDPAGSKASLTGKFSAIPTERDLPAFTGAVHVDEPESGGKRKKAAGSFVEIANAAPLLAKGPFTINVIMRFALGDGTFLEAGAEPALQWGLIDRDAGTLTLRLPGMSETLEPTGVFEKVGPLPRDRYQLFTLTYDGEGNVAFYIDGTECYRAAIPGLKGPLALPGGSIDFGSVPSSKSLFNGDLAALRIENGVHPPQPPAIPVAQDGVAGWAFDMTVDNVPALPGYQPVTVNDLFGSGRSFGWTAKPVGTNDSWFMAARYSSDLEAATKQGTRRARAFNLRDAILLPSGQGFQAKLPPGTYAVTASFGRIDTRQFVDRVEANGTVIGRDLITLPDTAANSLDRTARGFAQVGPDGILKITAFSREQDGKAPSIGFLSITAKPVPPLPVARDGNNLIWKGSGPAPAGFDEAAKAYAARDFDAAFDAAGKIADYLARATTRAWIVGYPSLTDNITLQRLTSIHNSILMYLRAHPDDLSALYLEDQTLLLWHAVEAYVFQAPSTRIFGPKKGRAWREGLNLALQIQPSEPLYGHARLLAANFIWQYGQQAGGYLTETEWRVPSQHTAYAPPPPLFREVLAAYPDAGMPKVFLSNNMSLSESGGNVTTLNEGRVPVAKQIPIPDGAPSWAAKQHRIITRLVDVVAYWHDKRMSEDGTMGGGFGDDVEMMRWWKTAVFVAGDENAFDGWQRLATLGWKSMDGQPMPAVQQDAEHVCEDFADSHGMQPFLHAGDPEFDTFMQRSRMLLPILKNVLMTRDDKGFLVFKAFRYSRLKSADPVADVPYNLRTIAPLVDYAFFRPDDKEVADIIIDYAKSWRDITLTAIDGKPAGIVPLMLLWGRTGLHLPAGGKLDKPTDWVYPGYLSFEYPAGYSSHVYDICLAAFFLSGDRSFLDPQLAALKLLGTLGEGSINMVASSGSMTTFQGATGLGDYDASKFPRGSLEWAARINRSGLGLAGAQYRAATGDKSYDDILLKHGPAYTQYVILAERAKTPEQLAAATKALDPMFDNILGTLDYNEVLRTQLPQSTDRVWVPGMDFLESTATGDLSAAPPPALRGEEEFWPMFAATWRKTGSDISILVRSNQSTSMDAYLYNFLETPKPIEARLWQLKPGRYRARLVASPDFKDGVETQVQEFQVKEKGTILGLTIPPRAQQHLIIEPVAPSA